MALYLERGARRVAYLAGTSSTKAYYEVTYDHAGVPAAWSTLVMVPKRNVRHDGDVPLFTSGARMLDKHAPGDHARFIAGYNFKSRRTAREYQRETEAIR